MIYTPNDWRFTLQTTEDLHSKRLKIYTPNDWRFTLETTEDLHSNSLILQPLSHGVKMNPTRATEAGS